MNRHERCFDHGTEGARRGVVAALGRCERGNDSVQVVSAGDPLEVCGRNALTRADCALNFQSGKKMTFVRQLVGDIFSDGYCQFAANSALKDNSYYFSFPQLVWAR